MTSQQSFGIATLFTHEAIDLLGEDVMQEMEQGTKNSAIKIKRMNGSASSDMVKYKEQYQDVIVVMARPDEEGPVKITAAKHDITKLPASDVHRIAQAHWYPSAVI